MTGPCPQVLVTHMAYEAPAYVIRQYWPGWHVVGLMTPKLLHVIVPHAAVSTLQVPFDPHVACVRPAPAQCAARREGSADADCAARCQGSAGSEGAARCGGSSLELVRIPELSQPRLRCY